MNDTPKVLVSSSDADTDWGEPAVIAHDVTARIRELKERSGENINVQASPTLVRFLLNEGLLDELHLLIHPVGVGTGKRLFDRGAVPASLRVIAAATFTTGVVSLRLAPETPRTPARRNTVARSVSDPTPV